MPAPRWLARFNRRATNHVTWTACPRLPGFGVVIHTGRKSGRPTAHRSTSFSVRDGFVFALTYGRDSQWVRNVLAQGGCRLETRGRTWQLTEPRLFHDPQHRAVPKPVGVILGLLKVDDFLEVRWSGSRGDVTRISRAEPCGRIVERSACGRRAASRLRRHRSLRNRHPG